MRPNLVVNPPSDDGFVNETHLLVGNGVETAIQLQGALRPRYPRAVVHERLLNGEHTPTMYVYRDGAWVRPSS